MTIIQAILLSLFTTVSGGLVGFWLGIIRERHNRMENKIIEEKLFFYPALERYIDEVKTHPLSNHARFESVRILQPFYLRLKAVLTGRRLQKLNAAWTDLETMNLVFENKDPKGTVELFTGIKNEEPEKAVALLVSKLEAIKTLVEQL